MTDHLLDQVQVRDAAELMLAALEALNLAYIGVPFKATPEQLPALKAASEMARDAIAAAKAAGIKAEG